MTFHYKSLYSNNRWSDFSHFYYSIARSLGKKISLQYQNDDVIDFADLDLNDDKSEETESKPSNGVSSMASRRESRGISEVSPGPAWPTNVLQNLLTTSHNFSVPTSPEMQFSCQKPVPLKY